MVNPSFAFCSAFDRVFRGRGFGLFAARVGGVLERPVVEVFLGDRVRARARDRFTGSEFAAGIAGVQLNPSSAGESLTVTFVQRDVAFVGRRERVFDDLTDFVVLRRVQVVRLGERRASVSVRPLIVSSAGGASASLLLALAVSLKDPLLRSSWVIVCVPVQMIDLPGASSRPGSPECS